MTARLIAEVFARLRTHGRFIVIQPNFRLAYRHYFDDYTHQLVFSHLSLADLLDAAGPGNDCTDVRVLETPGDG